MANEPDIFVPAVATSSTVFVEVESPGDLPEGYVFDAIYDGQTFSVTVPPGGVNRGERFSAPFEPKLLPPMITAMATPSPSSPNGIDNGGSISSSPSGYWKDGLFACFKHGICHPSCIIGFFATPILIGQVMTRMKLNYLGEPAPVEEWKRTFRRIAFIFVAFVILLMITSPTPQFDIDDDDTYFPHIKTNTPPGMGIVNNIVTLAFAIYFILILARLRRYIRATYQIPNGQTCSLCHSNEDFWCACCCVCCTTCQLARHTADYDNQPALFCSETGLPATSPIMIV